MYPAFLPHHEASQDIMALIFNILSLLLSAMQIVIIVRTLFSWFDPTGRTALAALLVTVTDPVIVPIRRVMPNTGIFDLSPMVAWLIIFLLQLLQSRSFSIRSLHCTETQKRAGEYIFRHALTLKVTRDASSAGLSGARSPCGSCQP